MQLFRILIPALTAMLLPAFIVADPARSQSFPSTPKLNVTPKLNAYVECINRFSERAYQSRERYFSWAAKSGPTGKERIIYGTYTIYDTSRCRQEVEKANLVEPRNHDLEAAATAFVSAVVVLEPLLKEADDYFSQEDYKDDKMAKGKALHPRLVAAWNDFALADKDLRARVESIQDEQALARLAEIEKSEGRSARYHVEKLMIEAKSVMRSQSGSSPSLSGFTRSIEAYESIVKATEEFAAANPKDKIGSSYIRDAKSYLATAKRLMRRLRDNIPYSSGEKMMMQSGGGGWMVDGSPARLMRDYNQLVGSYNRGGRF